jgi:hypothetical protein
VNAKTRQTRHVPLSEEALSVLECWREQSGDEHRVFDIATGIKTAWSHLLKRAHSNGSARGWVSQCRKLFRKPNGSEGVVESTDTGASQIAQSDLR